MSETIAGEATPQVANGPKVETKPQVGETRELGPRDLEGCACDRCGNHYRVDVHVPDELWVAIQPKSKPVGAGLLCGSCIMAAIEVRGEHNYFDLIPPRPWLRILAREQQRCNVEASVGMSQRPLKGQSEEPQ